MKSTWRELSFKPIKKHVNWRVRQLIIFQNLLTNKGTSFYSQHKRMHNSFFILFFCRVSPNMSVNILFGECNQQNRWVLPLPTIMSNQFCSLHKLFRDRFQNTAICSIFWFIRQTWYVKIRLFRFDSNGATCVVILSAETELYDATQTTAVTIMDSQSCDGPPLRYGSTITETLRCGRHYGMGWPLLTPCIAAAITVWVDHYGHPIVWWAAITVWVDHYGHPALWPPLRYGLTITDTLHCSRH